MDKPAPARKTSHLFKVLLLCGLLALIYSVLVPFGEPADEPAHFAYIWYLLRHGRLPVQSRDGDSNPVQEGHHPPGYYTVVAALTGWAPYQPYQPDLNPYLPVGYDDPHIVQQFLHPASERFPWQGPLRAAHIARLVSIGMGVVSVWATYQIGKKVAPRRPWVPLLAAGTHAFIPQFVYMSAAINNDNAATLIGSLVTLQMLRLLPDPATERASTPARMRSRGNIGFVLLGVLMGLGVLSKVSLLAMLPAVFWTVWCAARHRVGGARAALPVRQIALKAGCVLGPMLLLCGWWMWRNLRLYGDPLGYNIWMATYADFARQFPLTWDYVRHFWWQQFRSFWGLFGWSRVFLPSWLYLVLLGLTLLGIAGILRYLCRNRRSPSLPQKILLVFVVAGLVLSSWRLGLSLDLTAAQGRFLFPSLSAVTTLLAVGWLEWWAPARRSRVTRLVISGLFALTGAVLLFRLGPVHSRPLLAAPPSNARPVESDFGPGLWELVGWEAPQPVMEQAWPVTLYWRAQRELGEERRLAPLLFVHLVDASGEVVARWDGVPTQGRFPPPVWNPDTTVADALRLRISPQAQAGLAQLYVGFYFQEGDQLRRVTVRSATHPTLPGTLLLGPVMLRPAQPPGVHPQWTSPAIFGPIRLLGFDLEYADEVAGEVQDGGEVLRLVLYWQAEGEVTTDYTVFAHLVGAGGLVAQGDAPPCGGGCPTSLWQTGDVWRDEHVIPVALLSAAGAPYALSIGWYESSTGRRLPAFSPEGRQWEDDRVPLCTLSDWPGGECSP